MNIYAKIMVCLCLLAFALPIVIGRKCLTNLVVVEDNALGGKSYTFENSKPPRKEDCPSGYDTCIRGKCKGIDFYSCASGGDICNGLDCRDNDNNNKCSSSACGGNDFCNDPNFKPPSLESDSNGANTTPLHAMMLAIGGLGTLMVAGGMLI